MSVRDGGDGCIAGDGGDGCIAGEGSEGSDGVTSHQSSPACQNSREFGNKVRHYSLICDRADRSS